MSENSSNCVTVNSGSSSSEVCTEAVSSGITGTQGIVSIIACLIMFAILIVFITKRAKGKKSSIAIKNPYEADSEDYVPNFTPVYQKETTSSKEKQGVAKILLPAGWYATTAGDQDRYWDGAAWTEEYRPHVEPKAPETTVGDSRLSAEDLKEFAEEPNESDENASDEEAEKQEKAEDSES